MPGKLVSRRAAPPSRPTTHRSLPAKLEFALAGVRPNPSQVTELLVEFVPASAEPARLELIDVTERRVVARKVGGLGRQVGDLAEGADFTPELYLVRLNKAGNIADSADSSAATEPNEMESRSRWRQSTRDGQQPRSCGPPFGGPRNSRNVRLP